MSKERLEEIKQQLEESNSYDDNPNGYWYRNINWLYKYAKEQAERVQELEEENKRYREAREIIEQVFKESYVINSYGYEDGYLDGLDTAINIIDEALEDENE